MDIFTTQAGSIERGKKLKIQSLQPNNRLLAANGITELFIFNIAYYLTIIKKKKIFLQIVFLNLK